ncbi:MAG: TssQ family T6SS-associated lipoprotein [Pseudomonadota bacterium]|nr:TssQ family T6SS-associated lipoprotein [Pseudomonadota bacterium]
MMNTTRALPFALLLLVAACAEMPKLGGTQEPAAQKPAAPQITEDTLRTRARDHLAQGVKQYEAGEYDNAARSLGAALDHGLLAKAEQARARKLMAFMHCANGRESHCRDEFRKAFEIHPEFTLTSAEDGHPVWGPVYRSVRTQLVTEREAAQTRRSSGFMPLSRGETMLQEGLVKYDSGDYDNALKLIEAALKEGLKDKAEQVRAMKYVAFSLCLKDRAPACRAAFLKIYEVNPDFDLTPAEAGHPSWTRTFASVKAQVKKAAAEKTAKEKAAPPPAAAVPKKK